MDRDNAAEGFAEAMKPYYEQDGVTLYHGDAREIVPSLADCSVDFIFTDPPYGHNNNDGDLIHNWEKALGQPADACEPRPIANDDFDQANDLVRWLFSQAPRLLRTGGCCCCCCGGGGPDPQFARWSLWMDELIGFKHAVVWDKGGLGMGWHYRRNYELVLVGQKRGGPCRWFGGNTQPNVVRIAGLKPQASIHRGRRGGAVARDDGATATPAGATPREFLRVWERDSEAAVRDGWRFAAGWFHAQGQRWAWFERVED